MNWMHHFRVKPGSQVRLADIDPGYTGHHENKAAALDDLQTYAGRLVDLQYQLYAEGKHGLLIVLQAMDSGGKDGVIRHVLGYMNPQGCRVQAFKVPTAEEASHDFLWRVHKVTPAHGEVVIFNRSHYEDVLVTRVHELVPEHVWKTRYGRINDFEQALHDSNVHVLKFFLHISKEEQLRRFRKRLKDPARHWKISESDYTERQYWDVYQAAFEDALAHCSTEHAPWFVIPADHKWFRNLAISRIVTEYLESLDMHFPEAHVDIEEIRRKYHAEVERET